jgi:hypothetical protein
MEFRLPVSNDALRMRKESCGMWTSLWGTQLPPPQPPRIWSSLLDAACWASVDRIALRVGEAV